MINNTTRILYFIGFIIIVAFLGFAEFLQIYRGVNPCPLCVLQRITLGFLGITFLFGMALANKKRGLFGINLLALLITILGILFSSRQVWLQHMPTAVAGNCDVSLYFMLSVLPIDQVIMKIYQGGTTCSQVEWRFLNFSLAEWSLLWFVIFAIFSLYMLVRKKS